jgi:murein DD-endopeptidase MepM/ murein hydrolase activator NlpD
MTAKERNQKWVEFQERLKHRYRLMVMNDETFEEVGSYRLTLMNVYIALSVTIVVLVALVVLVFVFTPIKQYLPGYADVDERKQLSKIEKRLSDLEDELDAREVYIRSVRDALTANVKYKPDNVEEEDRTKGVTDTFLNVEPIAEDYQLRRNVEHSESFIGSRPAKAGLSGNSSRSIDQFYFVAPIKGTTSEGFRPDKKHYGIDIIAPKNTPIKAVADGVVVTSDWTYDTGNVIAVQHENNIISFYKHNSVLLKKVGSFVKAGEAVAIIGNTGELTDGPHLHFELWHDGNPVDPAEYIDFD